VCEEMVFRGVLLGGTRSLATWRILLLNGVVFGAFHLSIDTVVRFLPTAWLGIVITWAVLRTGSIWVGVLMHFLNNGAIVLLASVPALRRVIGSPDAAPPLWLIPVAVLSLAAGLRILSETPGATVAEAPTESEKR
jgi:sodium transport system permease protein